MLKDWRKKRGSASSGKKDEQKEKKSFWSYFFEPIPEDEDDSDFFDDDGFDEGRQYGEPPATDQLPPYFDEQEPTFSPMEDVAAVARLKWEDGEQIVSSLAAPIQTVSEEFDAYLRTGAPLPQNVQPPMDNPYVPLGTPVVTDNPYVPLGIPVVSDSPYVPLGAPVVTDNPYVPLGTPVVTDNPYVPLGTPVVTDSPYVPLGTPVATDNPYVPLGAPVVTDSPYVPLGEQTVAGMGSTPVLGLQTGIPIVPVYDPQTGLLIPPAFDPMTGQPIAPAFDPMTGKPLRQDTRYGARSDVAEDTGDDAFADEEGEEIRLFDEVSDAGDTHSGTKGQTTRLFRTGTGATTRIHINETEDAIRMEEAAKRARAREAREKHDAAMERKNRRKKRTTILRKLFANVAFVLFFIVAVVVALYYGFLLSDVVVLGNETYSTDYIVELSGLQKGRHMLLCNLDEAAQNIRQDPYLQVEQVNYIFPSRIRIVVKERKEVAGIIGLDYNVIIDDQGYVLSMSGGTDLSSLLQVTGVSMTGFQLGQQLGEGNDLGTATLVQIIGKLEEYDLMSSVKSIDMTTPLAITFTAKNGLNVHLGQASDLDYKMSTFARLLPQFVSQNIYQGTLYLSAKGGTVYSPPGAQGDVSANAADTAPVTAPDDAATLPVDQGTVLPGGDGTAGGDTTTPTEGLPETTPGATPTAPPTPTPYNPAGSSDEFQG